MLKEKLALRRRDVGCRRLLSMFRSVVPPKLSLGVEPPLNRSTAPGIARHNRSIAFTRASNNFGGTTRPFHNVDKELGLCEGWLKYCIWQLCCDQ